MIRKVVLVAVLIAVLVQPAHASTGGRPVKNVILVHGAWAEGADSWSKVIPLLQAKGLNVVAVHLPLTSMADDVATVKRAIALEDGPVLLVGHSYGGAVITEAGNDPKVVRLVYVAAFAPDAGQSAATLSATVAPPPLAAQVRPDAAGFLKITKTGIYDDFAQDLTPAEKSILYAAQVPTSITSLGGKITTAAWHTKSSWYIVAGDDRAIPRVLEATMAKTIRATTTTIPGASHVVMVSHPDAVASIVETAAGARQ